MVCFFQLFEMKYPVKFDVELLKNPYKGLYIAVEGIDGSGKTTQVKKLSEYFKSQGREVIVTREPRKQGFIGDLVHKVLLGEVKIPSVALQYLFSADRVIHHEEIVLPSLKAGKVVITDRCFWSAIVYGILDRSEGKYDKKTADLLLISQSILSMYHQFTVPDKTYLLQISLQEAMKRLNARPDAKAIYEEKNKIAKVLTGYDWLAKRFSKEIITLDGEQSVEKVTQDLIKQIQKIKK